MNNIIIAPIIVELSTEILDTLPIEEILYAEYAMPDAKKNAGRVILYIIKDSNLICYEANIYENENTYNKAVDILEKNQLTPHYNDEINKNGIFQLYNGGYGINVLINKNVSLVIRHGYFIYHKNDKKYNIYCSTREIFERIFIVMRRQERYNRTGWFMELLNK